MMAQSIIPAPARPRQEDFQLSATLGHTVSLRSACLECLPARLSSKTEKQGKGEDGKKRRRKRCVIVWPLRDFKIRISKVDS